MPATYAHKKFGDDVRAAFIQTFPALGTHPESFAAGLHGPDPLFYFKPLKKTPVRALGNALHLRSAAAFFTAARPLFAARGKRDADIAYLMGFACHFCLDSVCHGEVAAQMQKSGLTHEGIEAAFEKMLLAEDGFVPHRARLTGHIRPVPEAYEALAVYCGVSDGEAKKALSSMRFYCGLLRAPNRLKRGAVLAGLRLAGKYASVAPMLIPLKTTDAAQNACAALRPLYDAALHKANTLLPALWAFLSEGAPLHEAFYSNFESEEKI